MKIGVRAHDYGKRDIEELAALLHDEDYNAAQLALPKAFMGIDRYEDITMGHIEKIREAFASEIPDTTKFIIAQRVSSVAGADRILVLEDGRVDGFDTHENLLKTNAIYRDVYQSQTGGGGDFDEGGAD